MFLTPTGSSSRLPGRGDRVCHMPSDTAKGQQDKHMASGIIETEANMYVGLCITLKSPFLSLPPALGWSPATGGYQGDTASCCRNRSRPYASASVKKLFSLLGKHMSVPKVAANVGWSRFTLLLSAFALFILGHLGR